MVSLLLVHVYLDRISRFDGTRIVVNNEGPWLRKIDGVLRGVSVDVLALVIFQGDNASVLGVTSRYDVLDVETCGQGVGVVNQMIGLIKIGRASCRERV